jgi:hypothetical protein
MLVSNSLERKGIELNSCHPLIFQEKGKFKGVVYPVDLDASQGIYFTDESLYGKEEFCITPPITVSVPGRFRTKLETRWGRPVKFIRSTILRQLNINPRLTGTAVDSEMIRNALGLRPEIWQLIVALIVGVAIGWLVIP